VGAECGSVWLRAQSKTCPGGRVETENEKRKVCYKWGRPYEHTIKPFLPGPAQPQDDGLLKPMGPTLAEAGTHNNERTTTGRKPGHHSCERAKYDEGILGSERKGLITAAISSHIFVPCLHAAAACRRARSPPHDPGRAPTTSSDSIVGRSPVSSHHRHPHGNKTPSNFLVYT